MPEISIYFEHSCHETGMIWLMEIRYNDDCSQSLIIEPWPLSTIVTKNVICMPA